jgi:DNA polymerase-3 subunit beta
MIVHCEPKRLQDAMQIVSKAIPTKGTPGVYHGARASAEDGKLTLVGTDLEIGIRRELDMMRVDEPGVAIWPAQRLTQILREVGAVDIKISVDRDKAKVGAGFSDFEMNLESSDAFSDIPTLEPDDQSFELPAGRLRQELDRTVFAAAVDEGKYAMRGVMWDIGADSIRLVATDSKRLAVATLNHQVPESIEKKSALVPSKACRLMAEVLTDEPDDATVRVSIKDNSFLLRTKDTTVFSRLLDGRFPPYQNVIPKKFNHKIDLNVGEFLSSIRQAAIMTDDESKRIIFNFAPGKLTLSAHGSTTGKSKVVHNLPDFTGPEISINFDPLFLTEFLKVPERKETVKLSLVDSERPGVFTLGDDYLYLVVPLV